MQQLASIEQSLAKVFEGFPHLPKSVREWIADNVWWIVIIGVVLGALGLLWILFATALFGPFLIGYIAAVATVQQSVITTLVSVISFAAGVATLVLEAMAIQPLKAKLKRGWNLIFLSVLISFAASVINALLGANIGSLLSTILGTGIALYLLFELRAYFGGATKPLTAPSAKAEGDLTPPKPPVAS